VKKSLFAVSVDNLFAENSTPFVLKTYWSLKTSVPSAKIATEKLKG
jgi:hypothetical protein